MSTTNSYFWLILSSNWRLMHNPNGSWGFNWNWYLFYPNSEIPRSKGICYSSCRSKSQVYLQGALQCKDNSLDQMCHNAPLEFQSLHAILVHSSIELEGFLVAKNL